MLFLWLLYFHLLVRGAITSDPRHEKTQALSLYRRATTPSRNAWLIVYYQPEQIQPAPGISSQIYQNIHAALEIANDGADAQIKVQIQSYMQDGERRYVIETMDVRSDHVPQPVEADPYRAPEAQARIPTRAVFALEQKVTVSNSQLVDPETGKGIIADIWSKNVNYHLLNNNCNDFIMNLCKELKLEIPPAVESAFRGQVDFYKNIDIYSEVKNVPVGLKSQRDTSQQGFKVLREFDVTDPKAPIVVRSEGGTWAKVALAAQEAVQKATVTFRGVVQSLTDFYNDATSCFRSPPEVQEVINLFDRPPSSSGASDGLVELALYDDDEAVDLIRGQCPTKRSLRIDRRACAQTNEAGDKLKEAGVKELVVTRTKGNFNVMRIFDSPVLQGVGVAATVAAVAFIILDFVNGDFKAATIGTASLLVGIGVTLEVGGPVGLIAGAVVATLFAILPGLFDAKAAPPSNNPAQIVQFAFFGDRDHTGNEKCNDARKAQGLEPNCTVVYGAGVIAKSFKWEMFDAIAFLVQHNQGQAMSILDIAAAFHVIDATKSGDGNDAIATIDCGKLIQTIDQSHPHASAGGPQQTPSTGLPCNSAKFAIKREKITFPFLGSTADNIYKRIIPEQNGDCKMLSDPSEGFRSAVSNTTIRGRPVGVACNLTGTANVDGIVSNTGALQNSSSSSSCNQTTTNSNGTCSLFYTPPGISSDGSVGRAYEPAPPASQFTPLTPDNSSCLVAETARVCLPSGKYAAQTNKLGFATKGVHSVLQPSDASVIFSVPVRQPKPFPDKIETRTYTGNQDGDPFKKDFSSAVSGVFNISLATDPPCMCLYTDKDFKGDTQCYGVGGGNLTDPVTKTAQSLSLHGSVSAWVYAESYDDKGGAKITTDVADLTQLPYGNRETGGENNDNFSQRIVALWVKQPDT